jgi:hypothetical protein
VIIKRLFVSLVVASGLAVGGSQIAAASNPLDLTGYKTTKSGATAIHTAESDAADFFAALTSLFNSDGYMGTLDYLASYVSLSPTTLESKTLGVQDGIAWAGNINFNSVKETISFTGNTSGGLGKASGTLGVPGPVAGAGIPVVLAIAGCVAWSRRKGLYGAF